MVNSLVQAPRKRAGLELRLPKCTWTQVQRKEQPASEVPEKCTSFKSIKQAPTTGTLRVLGAMVAMDRPRRQDRTPRTHTTDGDRAAMEQCLVAEDVAGLAPQRNGPDVCGYNEATDVWGDDVGKKDCKPTSTLPRGKRFHGKSQLRTKHSGRNKRKALSQGSPASLSAMYSSRDGSRFRPEQKRASGLERQN